MTSRSPFRGLRGIPNLFTLLNLIFGCVAIIFTLQNGITVFTNSEGTQLLDIPEKIWMASLFIGLAAVVDFFDGFVARLFKASSEMGKELDSLADVVRVSSARIRSTSFNTSNARSVMSFKLPMGEGTI